jgi:hypothetical protein
MATGYWVSQAIYVAAKLGSADLLERGPQSALVLADATQPDAPSLFRLLQALSSVWSLSQVGKDCFALAPGGKALRSDVPGSLRATVITIGERFITGHAESFFTASKLGVSCFQPGVWSKLVRLPAAKQ